MILLPPYQLALPAPAPLPRPDPGYSSVKVDAEFFIRTRNGVRFLQGQNNERFELVRTTVKLTGERVWQVFKLKNDER